ncbi:hypothetical protein KKE78_00850 [Patescibacteria group bacterium]|nr:hypothetical protein [Patescibacteria group bacterium]
MPIHLIFEGAELSGKSFLMSQIYPILESKNFTSDNFLNGCFWINSDIGIFGTQYGTKVIQEYIKIAEILKGKPILFEKFHLSDMVYKEQSGQEVIDYSAVEERLKKLGFKIVLTVFEENPALIKQRLKDRIKLYPHYRRIAKPPEYYIKQQRLYLDLIKKSSLPYKIVKLQSFSEDETAELFKWLSIDK